MMTTTIVIALLLLVMDSTRAFALHASEKLPRRMLQRSNSWPRPEDGRGRFPSSPYERSASCGKEPSSADDDHQEGAAAAIADKQWDEPIPLRLTLSRTTAPIRDDDVRGRADPSPIDVEPAPPPIDVVPTTPPIGNDEDGGRAAPPPVDVVLAMDRPVRPIRFRPLVTDSARRRFATSESVVATAVVVAVVLGALLSLRLQRVPGVRPGSRFACELEPRSFIYRTKTGRSIPIRTRMPTPSPPDAPSVAIR